MITNLRSLVFILRLVMMSAVLMAGCCCAASSGFVTLEKDDGVWWFKSPEGKPFLSIGANHVEPTYWQSPNNDKFVAETYGTDFFLPDGNIRDGSPSAAKWAEHVAANFKNWGFNTFGFHNPLYNSLHSAGVPYYVVQLDIPTPWGWNMSRSELLRALKKRPTDVFSNEFVAIVEANALEQVKPRANDPQVLGYAYTDGPPWTVDDDKNPEVHAKLNEVEKTLHPWVLTLMSQPAGAKGKQAWIEMMKERYPSAENAGAVYGVNTPTWDALAAMTTWTTISDPAKAADDSQTFLEKIMRQWYAVRKNAIRKYDPNHLILGDKLNMNRDRRHPDLLARSLHLMKDYVDVINIQYYAPFSEQKDTLDFLYKESQLPVLNGDTACNPLWEDNPVGNAEFYAKLGRMYADHVTRLFGLPYFIGWHHCGYMRGLRRPYVEALKRGDQKAVQGFEKSKTTYREGFVSEFEEPIDALVKPLGSAVQNCEKLHSESGGAEKPQ